MGWSHILTVGILGLYVNLVLIRLVDMGSNGMFSYPHCRYTLAIGGSGFKQIGGRRF